MRTQEPCYLAYLLRLWQAGSDEELTWRASLESPRTGERRSFANLKALMAFLEEQTRSTEHPPATSDERKEKVS